MGRRNRERGARTARKPRPREKPAPARAPREVAPEALRPLGRIALRLPGFFASSIGETRWFAPALTAAYALLLAFTLFHHEMWRDEVQAWMFARDSTGPLDLFRNMEYEASPMLWHLLLMPITRLTSSPVGMQLLHLAIASAAIFVVARYAPFGPLQKILFSFGYFPLYEYGVMSRNYALGLLFVVVACALMRQRYRRPLWLALALALMSHTSVHACIVAIGILLALMLDFFLNRRTLAEDGGVDVRKLYAGFAIASIGILLSVLQMIPPADVTKSGGSATWLYSWFLELNAAALQQILALIPFAVFFPVDPRFVPVVGLTPEHPEAVYGVFMAVALVIAVVAFHWRKPVALALFLGLVAGLLGFFYVMHIGSFRHHGFLLVALLVLVWGGRDLAGRSAGSDVRSTAGGRFKIDGKRIGSILLTVFLAMHAFGGLRAVAIEVERPFSHGARAAEYIRENNLESLPMIGFPDWSASAVLGHLSPQKRIHYVQGNRQGSFVIYDGARIGDGPRGSFYVSTLVSQTHALATRNDGKVLMILAFELEIPSDYRRIRPLASFTGAIAEDEDFHLYLYVAPADEDEDTRAPGG